MDRAVFFQELRRVLQREGFTTQAEQDTGVKNVRANYHFTQHPRTLVCHVTLCCTHLVPPHVTEEYE